MAHASTRRLPAANFLARLTMLIALSFATLAQPAMAQSILRDAETEAVLRDMSKPLIEAANLRPEDVNLVLIHDPSINAFVATGQNVYIHSGLITSADNANEVQGVIAHEIGHIAGGHSIRIGEGIRVATGITLLSLLLGAAAMAAGAGEAGAGIMAAGQQMAVHRFLAFSREQESRTDQAGASYLSKAGVSGRGSLAFFERLQNQEYRLAIPQDNGYARTHPLNRERLAALEHLYKNDPAWDTPTDPLLEARFQRVKAKLSGYVDEPRHTMIRYPETDRSIPARYARAYAWHKSAHPQKALAEVESLLAEAPDDPYFLELKGQVLLESGKPREALASLREAVRLAPDQPLIASMFGHALIATEDPQYFEEAKRILRNAVVRDNSNPFAWYQLGIIYDREGDASRAALATAERYSLQGQNRLALANAEHALRGLPTGTADWLRAQDIAMVARTEVERERRRR
ncbi:MAG: M48 family metalloprotease [Allosphingosinicella sp.]|uniref:M48 family metalloprotease n=1 Tax=Allosphingosinicella sp. TaxID=2823234 RepID=UPI00392AE912